MIIILVLSIRYSLSVIPYLILIYIINLIIII